MNIPFNALLGNKKCRMCGSYAEVDTENGLYIVKCSDLFCDNHTKGTTYSFEAIGEWDEKN